MTNFTWVLTNQDGRSVSFTSQTYEEMRANQDEKRKFQDQVDHAARINALVVQRSPVEKFIWEANDIIPF